LLADQAVECPNGSDVPSKVRQDIGTKRFMLTVIWGLDGFRVVDLMTSQLSFNSWYFVNHVMAPMIAKVSPHGKTPHARRLQDHLDNCGVHFSKTTQQLISENHIFYVPHSPYSPDLARSDFWLFGHVKTTLVGQRFEKPEECLEAVTKFVNEIQRSELEPAFSHWLERVRWVPVNNGLPETWS
jgi:hypothetical protein